MFLYGTPASGHRVASTKTPIGFRDYSSEFSFLSVVSG